MKQKPLRQKMSLKQLQKFCNFVSNDVQYEENKVKKFFIIIHGATTKPKKLGLTPIEAKTKKS